MSADKILTPDDAAKILQVPVSTVVRMCRDGSMPTAKKVAGKWTIRSAGIDALFGQRIGPARINVEAFVAAVSRYQSDRREFVYFIAEEDDGPVKIGYTRDVYRRVFLLQSGNPRQLSLLGYVVGVPQLERELHRICAPAHIRGEWFRRTVSIVTAIRKVTCA